MILASQRKAISTSEFLPKALIANFLAIDTETNGEDIRDGRGYCIGISCTLKEGDSLYSAYFPVGHTKDNVPVEEKELLFQIFATRKAVAFHNAKFDTVSLKTAGFEKGFQRYYCTMLMSHMLNENLQNKSLEYLAKIILKDPGKVKSEEWEAWFKIFGWSPNFPAHVMATYAIGDTEILYMLFEYLYPYFVKQGFDGHDPMQWLQEFLPKE